MALSTCPDCGREVSDLAVACPHCGRPLKEATTPPPAPMPMRPGVTSGTTTAVRLFFGFTALLGVASMVAQIREIGVFQDFWFENGSLVDLIDAENLTSGVIGFGAIAGIVLGILLMIWGNKAYWQARRSEPTGEKWSPGWAVGGWFIPFANFIIPKLVLNEIDRMSHPDNDPPPIGGGWRSRPVLSIGRVWWLLSIAGIVLIGIGSSITTDQVETIRSFDGETYRTGLWLLAIGMGVGGAGQVAGISYFKELGARFHGSAE